MLLMSDLQNQAANIVWSQYRIQQPRNVTDKYDPSTNCCAVTNNSFLINVWHIRLLVVMEDNIKQRQLERDNAVWRHFDYDWESRRVEGVVVLYGAANIYGALWEESTGNKNKDDYRRLAYTHNIEESRVSGCYNEIRTLLTENNLRLMLEGAPLVDEVSL